MITTTFFGKIGDTMHRLAQSRKTVAQALLTTAGLVTEMVNVFLMWAQIFGADKDRQARLELTLHTIAGTLTIVGNRLAEQFMKEDVALKTSLPAPVVIPPATVVQTGDSPRSTSTVVNNAPKA